MPVLPQILPQERAGPAPGQPLPPAARRVVVEPAAAAYAARVDGQVEAREVYLEGFPKHRPTDAASKANNFWRYYGKLSRYRRHLGCILLKTTAVC